MPAPTMIAAPRGRGQSGLDRLLLFVVLAIALVIIAPHVLGLAGIDVSGDGSGPTAPPDHDLAILAARGEAVDASEPSVGAVRLVVSPEPGREPVDLRAGTAIWIGEETFDLVPVGSGGDDADGRYGVAAVDGESAVLERPTDRGTLRFDLGTDDVPDVPEFGDRLAAGETATVVLVTPRGETVSRQLTVPSDVPAGAAEVGL